MARVDGMMRWVQSETGVAICRWAVGLNAIANVSAALSVLDVYLNTGSRACGALLWCFGAVFLEPHLYRSDAGRQATADASGHIQANPRWDQSEWRLISCLFGLLWLGIFLVAGVHQNRFCSSTH